MSSSNQETEIRPDRARGLINLLKILPVALSVGVFMYVYDNTCSLFAASNSMFLLGIIFWCTAMLVSLKLKRIMPWHQTLEDQEIETNKVVYITEEKNQERRNSLSNLFISLDVFALLCLCTFSFTSTSSSQNVLTIVLGSLWVGSAVSLGVYEAYIEKDYLQQLHRSERRNVRCYAYILFNLLPFIVAMVGMRYMAPYLYPANEDLIGVCFMLQTLTVAVDQFRLEKNRKSFFWYNSGLPQIRTQIMDA